MGMAYPIWREWVPHAALTKFFDLM